MELNILESLPCFYTKWYCGKHWLTWCVFHKSVSMFSTLNSVSLLRQSVLPFFGKNSGSITCTSVSDSSSKSFSWSKPSFFSVRVEARVIYSYVRVFSVYPSVLGPSFNFYLDSSSKHFVGSNLGPQETKCVKWDSPVPNWSPTIFTNGGAHRPGFWMKITELVWHYRRRSPNLFVIMSSFKGAYE